MEAGGLVACVAGGEAVVGGSSETEACWSVAAGLVEAEVAGEADSSEPEAGSSVAGKSSGDAVGSVSSTSSGTVEGCCPVTVGTRMI